MKIKKMLICMLSVLMLSSCNYQVIDLTYKYDKVHIYETGSCYDIKKWTDYEGEQLQIQLNNDSTILLSSVNCMLVSGKCHICNE